MFAEWMLLMSWSSAAFIPGVRLHAVSLCLLERRCNLEKEGEEELDLSAYFYRARRVHTPEPLSEFLGVSLHVKMVDDPFTGELRL